MSGGYLLGLIGISMASLFALAGLLMNFHAWRTARRARPGARAAAGIPILPGVVGSVTLFFLIPQLTTRFGLEVPWPFFWILLPLFLDLRGLGGLLLALVGLRGEPPQDGPD
ncbi:MAG: hypothetical protein AMJ64_13650 [Betaproteobacteria bacterium SG8_39]|nr:MAG: hypothetical protein AMJ64_13650 [Betaproteobacteria bacterium SG8_39]